MTENIPVGSKESGINRVVGFETGTEDKILSHFKNLFENNRKDRLDKELSTEERALIQKCNDDIGAFLTRYGVEAVEVPVDNIHVLNKTMLSEQEQSEIEKRFGTEQGFYQAGSQSIGMLKDLSEGKLSFMQTLAHEMLHVQGFYSFQKSTKEAAEFSIRNTEEASSLNTRRSGFSVGTRDGQVWLFHYVNEAVITELAIRFEESHLSHWPELETELKQKDDLIEQLAKENSVPVEVVKRRVSQIWKDESGKFRWKTHSYHHERQELNKLIDQIYERNKGQFTTREDVFTLFAEATLTGHLLPIARLIEKTFGSGSFRKLAEDSSRVWKNDKTD